MIPYEDLVYALAEWRARQGLPVATTPTPAARPVAASPARPMAPQSSPVVHAAPAAAPMHAPPAHEHGYGAPTPAHATAAYAPASYPGAHAAHAAFGGAAPAHDAAAPNLAAVQATFAGAAHYEHQITDEDEVITLGEAPSSADPLSFEGARSGTQPGVAPGFNPGARR